MEFQGEVRAAELENNRPVFTKILVIRYGGHQKLFGIIQNQRYSYVSVVGMIRSLLGNPFLYNETVHLHLTPEPRPGSMIRNNEDIQNAINFAGPHTVIYVTSSFSTEALRNRFIGTNIRLQFIENDMTELLSLLRDSDILSTNRGPSRRGARPRRGRRGRAPPRMPERSN